ncbi:MAG: oligosaccharide flippase family protein [Campylobacterales bacterium]|nr:oligosaccharide flippase family protein [Campylobacterales bacterium]
MSLAKNYFRLSVGVTGIQYLFFGINLIGGIFLARLLTPELFGEIALVLSLLALLELFFTLSVSSAYIVTPQTKTLFSSAIILTLISWGVLFVVVLLLLYPMLYFYDPTIVKYLVSIVIVRLFGYLGGIYLANLDKNLQVYKSSLVSGISSLLSLVLALLVAVTEYQDFSLIARELTGGVITFVLAIGLSRQRFTFIYQADEIKILFRYSIKMFFSKAAETAYFKLPFFLIGSLFGMATLGLVSQMFYLAALPNTALGAFTDKVAFTFYAKHNKDTNGQHLMFYTNVLIVLLTLPVALLVYFYSAEILLLIYGTKWIDGAVYLQYLSIMIILLPLFHNLRTYCYSITKNQLVTFSYIVAVIALTIFVCVIYWYHISQYFLALSISISYVVAFVLLISRFLKYKRDLL